MEIQSDFKELLELFNSHQVEYLITGAYALAFHGAPRYTGDIDLYINPNPRNAERIISALQGSGVRPRFFPSSSTKLKNLKKSWSDPMRALGLKPDDFTKSGQIIQLGKPPARIDIITSISGVSWQEAEAGKVPGSCGGVPVNFIGREEFIVNKRATGRKKDLADIESLGSS